MPDTNGTVTKKKTLWAQLNKRGKMYFVLALCCAALLLTVIAAIFIVHGLGEDTANVGVTVISSEPLVADSDYDKDQNIIDTAEYTTTILEPSEDAGQTYVDETLFLGDSNTARMYRMFTYCSYGNAIGSVGMAAKQLDSFACVKFDGYSGYKTMPEAVALIQPKRVILTFGTNDLNPNISAESFIAEYQKGIEAVQAAYPSVDVIVNSIPPLGKEHTGSSLSQSQVDAYNKAIVQMCKDKDWKYLNTAEALKDESTGYAKDGYTETSDGIHLTSAAMDAMFNYIRTHSYILEDDRPALTDIPTHTDDKDVVVYTVPVVATAAPTAVPTEEPVETPAEEMPETTQEPDVIIDNGGTSSNEQPVVQPTATPSPNVVVPTEVPVVVPTEAPLVVPTEVPVVVPTEAPLVVPTEVPVVVPTEAPVATPTEAPVVVPTEVPAPEVTDAPAEPTAPTDGMQATEQVVTG